MPLPFHLEHLWDAWERVRENEGCAGCDGVTVERFGDRVHRELDKLIEQVNAGVYRPFRCSRLWSRSTREARGQ